jgi:hypothetical protein
MLDAGCWVLVFEAKDKVKARKTRNRKQETSNEKPATGNN